MTEYPKFPKLRDWPPEAYRPTGTFSDVTEAAIDLERHLMSEFGQLNVRQGLELQTSLYPEAMTQHLASSIIGPREGRRPMAVYVNEIVQHMVTDLTDFERIQANSTAIDALLAWVDAGGKVEQ